MACLPQTARQCTAMLAAPRQWELLSAAFFPLPFQQALVRGDVHVPTVCGQGFPLPTSSGGCSRAVLGTFSWHRGRGRAPCPLLLLQAVATGPSAAEVRNGCCWPERTKGSHRLQGAALHSAGSKSTFFSAVAFLYFLPL